MKNSNDNLQEGAEDFLKNDFNQCFAQVRHYDSQMVQIFKYLATFYTTIAGIAIGLYQFSIEKNIDLNTALISGLSVALLFGLCMYFLIVRNRVYFVFCMRYINEQRALFLSTKPFGFKNKSKIYDDYTKPKFFNLLSSQIWWLYIIAILNSALIGVILLISKQSLSTTLIFSLILFLFQLLSGIIYLKSRENKSASVAVFGKK